MTKYITDATEMYFDDSDKENSDEKDYKAHWIQKKLF